VPTAVDAGGSAPTGHLTSSPATIRTHRAGIFCAPPYPPRLIDLASRLRFVLVLIITMGRAVIATSRRAE
jgi:hypothetical protein